MSLKNYGIKLIIVCLVFAACKKEKISFSKYTSSQKDTMANWYDDMSVYYLQPSEIHRSYKDSAIMLQPDNVNLIQRLSYSYKKVGDHIKAMQILNKAVTIDTAKGKAGALQYRAWTLLYFYRDYKGTIRDVNLIEKITGKKFNPCWGEPCGMHKGQALYKLGRYDEAIEVLKRVNIEEEKLGFDVSGNHLVFFYIGRCYAEKKEYESALENFEKSQKGAYNMFPEAYYQTGLIYKALGKIKKAKLYFEKSKKLEDYKMGEPYIERFDEVFPYMIDKELKEF